MRSCRVCEMQRCKIDHPKWPCTRCEQWLDKKRFHLVQRPGRTPRRASRCRKCLAANRKLQNRTTGDQWVRMLWQRYRLTPEQYEKILEDQEGVCAICGREPLTERLSVDHDHRCCPGVGSCGLCRRGLICRPCNTGIALLHDEIVVLEQAILYLRKFHVGQV
jgi:hypothetical protein